MPSVKFESRTVQPSKILCVGRNYVEHIEELGNAIPTEMVVFNKPNSSISNNLKAVDGERLHYEAEICFLVEKGQFVGVGFGLDLTKRETQSRLKAKGLPWERAKAFDGSAVFSRFVPITDLEISQLEVELYINCVRVQKGSTSQMLYPPLTILDELKTYTALCDGDVIMTGTPKGVGEVHAGDVFLGRIKLGDTILLESEWVAKA